jgi:light-harvesting complex II chlorophyll a/b binding protein 4
VELDGAQYANLSLPFTIGQLCWIEAILVGGAEIYRNSETDTSKRCAAAALLPWVQQSRSTQA